MTPNNKPQTRQKGEVKQVAVKNGKPIFRYVPSADTIKELERRKQVLYGPKKQRCFE